jgi:mRNA interferase YafQ
MRILQTTSQFKRDLRRAFKRGKAQERFSATVRSLQNDEQLPVNIRDHKLGGDYHDCRECHIEPDWLLIYRKTATSLILIRTGTHCDLFKE